MAVQSDTSRIQYAGNNSTTTSYAVPFVFQENSHLKAIARTSAGVESVVTLTNHTGAGNVNGGTVRTAVAVPATSTLTIYREVPATQTTTYAEGGDFPAASHERALDKLTYLVQQLGRAVARCVRLTDAAPESSAIPAVANQFFGTDANGAIVMVAGVNAAPESITNLSISPTAAIAGTKIAPNFGSQDVVTTGRIGAGTASPTVPLDVRGSTSSARIISTTSTNHAVVGVGTEINQLRVGMEGSSGGTLLFGTAAYSGVIGTDTAQPLALGTNATERLRIDASGNVGIGTSSPAAGAGSAKSLDVAGPLLAGGVINSHQTNKGVFQYGSNVTTIRSYGDTAGSGEIVFNTGGGGGSPDTERLRIIGSGNVGIGTGSPASSLHLAKANGAVLRVTTLAGDGGGNSSILMGNQDSAGTNAPCVIRSANTALIFGVGNSWSSETGGTLTERMRIDSDGLVTISQGVSGQGLSLGRNGSDGGGVMSALNGATGSLSFATNSTERLRINASGNVGIGTASPATRLHVDGTIRYTNRPAAGTITAIGFDANGDLRASSSSLRYKHNVEPYAKGLAEVAQLEPVTFNYNGEELVNAGLIVEDLDELGLEEFVLRDAEGTADAIPYGNMVALLINAIKELKVRVEELEAAQ